MNSSTLLRNHYIKADTLMLGVNLGLVGIALLLAQWYETWPEAIIIGGFTAAALSFIWRTAKGSLICRVAMAAGTMVLSALHIHQAHGMIEFHFGIFALLAVLLFYRDWVPVVVAAAVIAVHHFSFFYLQASGSGVWVLNSTDDGLWVIFIHAGYVVVETALVVVFAVDLKKEAQQATEMMHITDQITHDSQLNLSHRTTGSTELLERFNGFITDIDNLATQVKTTASQLLSQGSDLSRVTGRVKESSHTQQQETAMIAAAVEEMTAAIAGVNDNANAAAQASTTLDNNARQAREVGEKTKNHVQLLADSVEEAVESIESLNQQANNIGGVLDVICGIAEQTNLLALNAAIEAARAGEQGRGFAVVADEVRTLAQRTQQSTQEIDQMIEKLQSGSKSAVQIIEQSRLRGQESVADTNQSLELMEQVSQSVQCINEMNSVIANSTLEQNAVVCEISKNLNNILAATNSAVEDSEVTAEAADKLGNISEELKLLSDKFCTEAA